MRLAFLFIFLLLFISVIFASLLQKDINPKNPFSIQDSSDISEHYLNACSTIMYGRDQFLPDDEDYSFQFVFAIWQNGSPNVTFLDYFDHGQGKISKIFLGASSFSHWKFSLTFYDGKYIDQKFAKVETASLNIPLDITINQKNGTFTAKQDFILNLFYGEYEKQIKGQLRIYFMNKETLEPFTNIDANNEDVSKYSVQLEFVSSTDQSFSFITSLFSPVWDIATFDIVFSCIFTAIYILVSLTSLHTENLDDRVSIPTVFLGFLSSAFIVFWAITQIYNKKFSVFALQGIILVGFLADYAKNSYFLYKKDPSLSFILKNIDCLFLIMLGIICFFRVSCPLFLSFLPCLALIPSLIIKIKEGSEFQDEITRFEISQWICASLWIGYTHLYSGNFYLFSPRPMLVYPFWIIIILQFVVSLMLKIWQRRRERAREILLLNQYSPRDRHHEVEYQYNFILTEENRNILSTEPCSVCYENLISEEQKNLYKTPCNHFFHEECLRGWGKYHLSCPDCRETLPRFRDPVNQIVEL